MFTLTHRNGDTSSPPFNWVGRITSTITSFWSRRRGEGHVPLMIADLRAFNDAMLKDIGLQRCRESVVLNCGGADWCAAIAPTGWRMAPIP
jgi:uncharacterized protein YjiS (DUF1127 family)